MSAALEGSALTATCALLSLIVSRIRCHYKRDPEGCQGCQCGCLEKPLGETDSEINVQEIQVGDVNAILLIPRDT